MAREPKEKPKNCPGGMDPFRQKHDHPIGKTADILCYRCKCRLGCSLCAPIVTERFCGRCRDWGSEAAMRRHGPMVRGPDNGAMAVKILFMVNAASITMEDGLKLYEELFQEGR